MVRGRPSVVVPVHVAVAVAVAVADTSDGGTCHLRIHIGRVWR
jgi:hypothetical protein